MLGASRYGRYEAVHYRKGQTQEMGGRHSWDGSPPGMIVRKHDIFHPLMEEA